MFNIEYSTLDKKCCLLFWKLIIEYSALKIKEEKQSQLNARY